MELNRRVVYQFILILLIGLIVTLFSLFNILKPKCETFDFSRLNLLHIDLYRKYIFTNKEDSMVLELNRFFFTDYKRAYLACEPRLEVTWFDAERNVELLFSFVYNNAYRKPKWGEISLVVTNGNLSNRLHYSKEFESIPIDQERNGDNINYVDSIFAVSNNFEVQSFNDKDGRHWKLSSRLNKIDFNKLESFDIVGK